jgi:DNA-binding MarR family transcriptional regulator
MEITEQMGSFEESVASGMMKMRKSFRSRLRKSILDYHLSQNELEVLLYLANNPGHTAKELANRRGISRSLVSKSVDLLMKQGYLRGEQDERDRRKIHLFLEEKADGLVQKMQDARLDFIQQIFRGISQEELTQIIQVLGKMINNLEEEPPEETATEEDR